MSTRSPLIPLVVLFILLCVTIGIGSYVLVDQHRTLNTVNQQLKTMSSTDNSILSVLQLLGPVVEKEMQLQRDNAAWEAAQAQYDAEGVTVVPQPNGDAVLTSSEHHFTVRVPAAWISTSTSERTAPPIQVGTGLHQVMGFSDFTTLRGKTISTGNFPVVVSELTNTAKLKDTQGRTFNTIYADFNTTLLQPRYEVMLGGMFTPCGRVAIASPYRVEAFECGGDGGSAFVAQVWAPSGKRWLITFWPMHFVGEKEVETFASSLREAK